MYHVMATIQTVAAFILTILPLVHLSEPDSLYGDDGILVAYSHRIIRYNSDYEINLHSLQKHHSANVTATLTASGKEVARQEKKMTAGQQAKMVFKIGSAILEQPIVLDVDVEYSNGMTRSESRELQLATDALVLIQLDKPMYKATDTVRYRVLVLNADALTLSTDIAEIDVYLKNPAGEIMQERKSQNWSQPEHPGYFEGTFNPFSFEPETGNWTVEVMAGRHIHRKTLMVADYYLPRYSVYVEAPSYIVKGQPDVQLSVSLRDQTGNPAYGTVNITIHNDVTGIRQLPLQAAKGQTIPIRCDIPFMTHTLVCAAPPSQRTFRVKIKAVEKVTNREEHAEVKIPFRCEPFKLQIQQKYNNPQPGIATIVVHAINHDGSPYRNATALHRAKIIASDRDYENDVTTTTTLTRDKVVNVDKGMIAVPMRMDWHVHNAHVNVTVGEVIKSMRIVDYGSSWVQIQLLQSKTPPSVGETVQFVVKCGPSCATFTYAVVSSKGLIINGVEPVSPHPKQSRPVTIRIPLGIRPAISIIAFTTNATAGEVASDSVVIKIGSPTQMQNISMDVRPESNRAYVLPGRREKAKVTVAAAPHSLVGLLAVDKNLLRLASGYDITQAEVLSQQAGFPKARQGESDLDDLFCFQDRLIDSCGLSSLASSFEESGLVVFTFESVYMMNSGVVNLHKAKFGQASGILRKDFRDSFLFITKTADAYGHAEFVELVPDSVTTWAVTAFAANSHQTLGLTSNPGELRVYQDWYIHVETPNTMLEYEKASIDITVYNFRAHAPDAETTLNVQCYKVPEKQQNTTQFRVKAGEPVQQFAFTVGPYKRGELHITASLTHPKLSVIDKVQKIFPIYPGGVVVIKTAEPVAIKQGTTSIRVDPKAIMQETNIVAESLNVSLNIFGDIWAPILDKVSMADYVREFGGLVRLPYGCGEQNMALLMPNVMLAHYLKAFPAKRLPIGVSKKLNFNMEKGFQRQFHYRLADGSYNTFGRNDQPGSTWLTAFVVRGLSMAKEFIKTDDSDIHKSIKFLNSKQNPDGSFREDGNVLDSGLLGGSGTGPALTAFVTLAYSESHQTDNPVMYKAKSYLEGTLPKVTDPYPLAITCFALSLLHSEVQGLCTAMLKDWATESRPDKRYWLAARTYEEWAGTKARDVETTAYALLALIHLHGNNDHQLDDLRIVNWLLAQRNGNGGFISTQDTVVALNALNDVSSCMRSNNQISGTISAGLKPVGSFTMAQQSLKIKTIRIPADADVVTVKAIGKGTLRGQLEYKYWTIPPRVRPPTAKPGQTRIREKVQAVSGIDLKVLLRRTGSNSDRLILSLCPRYKASVDSGMVVIEATALTGYQFDAESAKALEMEQSLGVDKADCVDNKARMEIYLREVLENEPCIHLNLYKYLSVENVAARPVKVYRYYEPSVSKTMEYSLEDAG